LSALWISGAVALALATWACFLLGLSSATAACVYLVIIVLLYIAVLPALNPIIDSNRRREIDLSEPLLMRSHLLCDGEQHRRNSMTSIGRFRNPQARSTQ
jgi:hypothetical protein